MRSIFSRCASSNSCGGPPQAALLLPRCRVDHWQFGVLNCSLSLKLALSWDQGGKKNEAENVKKQLRQKKRTLDHASTKPRNTKDTEQSDTLARILPPEPNPTQAYCHCALTRKIATMDSSASSQKDHSESSGVAPGFENRHQFSLNSRLPATNHITIYVQLSPRLLHKPTIGATWESHNDTNVGESLCDPEVQSFKTSTFPGEQKTGS